MRNEEGGRRKEEGGGRKEDFKVRKDVSVFSKQIVITCQRKKLMLKRSASFLPESPLRTTQNHFQDFPP